MTHTVEIATEIPSDRRIQVRLPDSVPVGPAEVRLTIASVERDVFSTLGDLADARWFGLWRGREDIVDSAEFATRLRSDSGQSAD